MPADWSAQIGRYPGTSFMNRSLWTRTRIDRRGVSRSKKIVDPAETAGVLVLFCNEGSRYIRIIKAIFHCVVRPLCQTLMEDPVIVDVRLGRCECDSQVYNGWRSWSIVHHLSPVLLVHWKHCTLPRLWCS